MKKFFVALTVLVMLVCVFTACNKDDEVVYNSELVKYGDFEASNAKSAWVSAYTLASSNAPIIVNDNAYTDPVHLSNIRIRNNSADYTYAKQSVVTENKGIYKLTVDVKVVSLKSNSYKYGAVISVAESDEILLNITSADNAWHTYTVYFQPKNLESFSLKLQLGAASNNAVGEVRFDNVSVQRVESVPDGASLTVVRPTVVKTNESSKSGLIYTIITGILGAAIVLAAYVAVRRKLGIENTQRFKDFFNSPIITLLIITLAGFAIRLLLTVFLFDDDNFSINFANYCKNLTELKLNTIYPKELGEFAPGALYLQWLVGKLMVWLKVESTLGMIILSKAPALLAEVVTIYLLYSVGSKFTNTKAAAVIAALYALLPVAFTITAADTAMLPLTVMLLLLTFTAVLDKNYILMFVWYFFAVFISEIALAVLPFILAYVVYLFIKNPDMQTRLTLCLGVVISFILLYSASLPFTLPFIKEGKILYIVRKYYQLAFEGQVCVNNAFNLYGIFNLNLKEVNNAANVLNILFMVALIVFTLSLYFKNRNRAELLLLTSFFMVGVSVFCLNMNHTAMYLGLALMLLYFLISGEKRVFASFGILSVISFVNISQYLNIAGAFVGSNSGANFAAKSPIMIIGGILAVAAAIYFGWVAYDITVNGNMKDVEPLYERPAPAFKNWLRYLLGKEAQ